MPYSITDKTGKDSDITTVKDNNSGQPGHSANTATIPWWFGALALVTYAAHAAELLIFHNALDLLWTCNVASLLACIALWRRNPLWCAVSCYILFIGTFYWVIDISTGGDFMWTSIFTHVGLTGLTLIAIHRLGLPRASWYVAGLTITLVIYVSGWIGDPEINVNLTHFIPKGLDNLYPSQAIFLLSQILFATLVIFVFHLILRRLGFQPPSRVNLKHATPAPLAVGHSDPEAFRNDFILTRLSVHSKDNAKDNAMNTTSAQRYAQHVNPAFVRALGMLKQGRLFTYASDVWVWDHQQNRYLDCSAGYGSVNIGHNHPALMQQIKHYLDQQALQFVHLGPSAFMGELAARLVDLADAPLEMVVFSNSGAEAVEAAMKMAHDATDRPGFVYLHGAYHGTSLGTRFALSHNDNEKDRSTSRIPSAPLILGANSYAVGIPANDMSAMQIALKDKRMAAVLIDPGLSESGGMLLDAGYLQQVAELCQRYGSLLILDEVQTGLGRTGKLFAYQHDNVVPDILVLAKSLSGGMSPIGATLASKPVFMKTYGSHDSFDRNFTTFGGNSLSCYVALQTLDILLRDNLVDNSRVQGELLLTALQQVLHEHPLVKSVRGRGLFIAIELGATDQSWLARQSSGLIDFLSSEVFGQWLVSELLQQGLLCQTATQAWQVIKIMPPLTLNDTQREQIVTSIDSVFTRYREPSVLVEQVAQRFTAQFMREWEF